MSNHRYSPEFKDETVDQLIERGYSIAEAAARLWVSAQLCTIGLNQTVCSICLSLLYPYGEATETDPRRTYHSLQSQPNH